MNMRHYCIKATCHQVFLVWQPSKRRFYCPNCHANFTRAEVALIQGGKA